MIEIKVPAVGESISEVTLVKWLKKDGDTVRLDEVIAEVESDKATFELPAEANGILRIVAKEQESLPTGIPAIAPVEGYAADCTGSFRGTRAALHARDGDDQALVTTLRRKRTA